jgi:hypothetical protein
MSNAVQITHAFWEKRNLGKDVYEVLVDKDATEHELLNVIDGIKGDLIYAKIQCENTKAIQRLIEKGFVYSENQFSIKKRLRNFDLPKLYKKTIRFLDIRLIENLDQAQVLFDELDNGLFTTDRVAMDSQFGVKVANLRYKNWITDMIKSKKYECAMIQTNQEHIPVGFYINQYQDNKIADCILGGIFNDYKSRGIGHSFIYFAIQNAINQGARVLKTQISSNNLPVFNIYSSVFGFEITNNYVVLKKHARLV